MNTALQKSLMQCCGSTAWVAQMTKRVPFKNEAELYQAAQKIWRGLGTSDWLEAFSHHPRIGEQALRQKYGATAHLSVVEQKGMDGAETQVIERLALLNTQYFEKFGFVFLICATGKSAKEMLTALEVRLDHTREQELKIACAEHEKITELRLAKIMHDLVSK